MEERWNGRRKLGEEDVDGTLKRGSDLFGVTGFFLEGFDAGV